MLLVLLTSCVSGCGTTISRGATEQLLASDAVDSSVSEIDFRDLKGQNVYFDTTYIKNVQSVGFVNSDYIISSLRQQILAADCRLLSSRENAEFIIEARVGALGADRHEIVWGVPANNLLGTVASAVPNAPPTTTIPEIAFAKKSDELAVAKIGVFAYHRETGRPVWQSGTNQAKSTARNTTVLGIGPFQSGTIHEGTEFAGSKIALPLLGAEEQERHSPVVPYASEVHFPQPNSETAIVGTESKPSADESKVKQAAAEPEKEAPVIIQPAAEQPQPSDTPPRLLKEETVPAAAETKPAPAATTKTVRPTTKAVLTKPSEQKWRKRKSSP